jgi:hypothetical protein
MFMLLEFDNLTENVSLIYGRSHYVTGSERREDGLNDLLVEA